MSTANDAGPQVSPGAPVAVGVPSASLEVVLLGGAAGIGKSTAARALLDVAARGAALVQWVDVDDLWLHQPWRVDDRMRELVQRNLRAVAHHAMDAGVDVLVITWVFQSDEMQDLVRGLLPPQCEVRTIQLLVDEPEWRARFLSDPTRPPINEFFESRYRDAQQTAADLKVKTDGLTPTAIAATLAEHLALQERRNPAQSGTP